MSEKESRVCPNCGDYEALDCGHGNWSKGNSNNPPEFDCLFPWDDTLYTDIDCGDCPLVFCKSCKDAILMNTFIFQESLQKVIHPITGDDSE